MPVVLYAATLVGGVLIGYVLRGAKQTPGPPPAPPQQMRRPR